MNARWWIAGLDLSLLPAVLGLCALTVLGAPRDPALRPRPLELLAYAIDAPEARRDALAAMAPVWEQLDPAPAEPEVVTEAPAPPQPPSVRATLVALAPHACIVQEDSGRQVALGIGDRWGEFEVTAITIRPHADRDADRVVGCVELEGGGGRRALELTHRD